MKSSHLNSSIMLSGNGVMNNREYYTKPVRPVKLPIQHTLDIMLLVLLDSEGIRLKSKGCMLRRCTITSEWV